MSLGPIIQANSRLEREVHPAFPVSVNSRLTPYNHPHFPTQDSFVRAYGHVLLKRKWIVLSCFVLIVSAVLIATLRSTPIYDAVGSIAVNRMDPVTLNLKDSENPGYDYSDPTDLDTEVRILHSDSLAWQVIKQLGLDKTPGAAPASSSSLGLTTDNQFDSDKASQMIASFKSNLSVILEPNTRVIDIHYRSPDKYLAARAVNALASAYVEQNFKTRFESTEQTSDWLSKQLIDLQMKVETSQEKLVKYQKDHEILGIDEKQNITTSKLDELNRELTGAESARMEKESLYRLIQAGDSDSIAAAANIATTTTSGSASSLLQKLQEEHADLKIQIAKLGAQFGPSYPKIAELTDQLKEVDAQTEVERKKVVERLRGDYLAALARENLLRTALDQQKQDENQLNESAIEYNFLKRDAETNRTLYENLLEKLKEAGVTAGLRSNNIRPVDLARVPSSPAEPNLFRNLSFASVLGLTTGILLAFVLEGLDNTVRTLEQAQAISMLPSLGIIPLGSGGASYTSTGRRLTFAGSKESMELITKSRPQSQMAEAYRALRTSLLLTSVGAPPKVILVTSALPEEGKTTTCINCAIVLAQKGGRVLLIDSDLRRPGIHRTLGIVPKTGLTNVLTGSATLQQAIVRSPLVPSLSVLPAGTPPPNPAELLASGKMGEVLETLREQYDHIVIDTPPTLPVTDAVIMATRADAVILVIRAGSTTKHALRQARDILLQVNARISGVLLNAVNLGSPDYYSYYGRMGKFGRSYYREDYKETDGPNDDASGNDEIISAITSGGA
jgi:capsular exopolysaccharide synthesis family protein